jgi:hypothetical protein
MAPLTPLTGMLSSITDSAIMTNNNDTTTFHDDSDGDDEFVRLLLIPIPMAFAIIVDDGDVVFVVEVSLLLGLKWLA